MTGLRLPICVAAVVAFTATVESQRTIHIVVTDTPRPVSAAVEQIERQFGQRVTYEDVIYVHPDDVRDATSEIRRDGRTSPKIFAMRSGSIDIEYTPAGKSTVAQVGDILARVVAQSRAIGNAGEFRVERVDGGHHVIPVAVKGRSGQIEPFIPLLDTRITLDRREENGMNAFLRIIGAVAGTSGRALEPGLSPTNRFFQRKVTLGADHEPARDVLWRALNELGGDLSWRLLCGAGDAATCALNVHWVSTRSNVK